MPIGVNTIIQHGSYAIAASNVQAGTLDDVPEWNSDCQTVDHSSSSRSGGLLYKKHGKSQFTYQNCAFHTLLPRYWSA